MLKLYRRILVWLLRLDPNIVVVAIITRDEMKQTAKFMEEFEHQVHLPPERPQVVH